MKKIVATIVPYKPIKQMIYRCDNTFYIEPLLSQFKDENKYGFIIIDGHGTLIATISGDTKTILCRYPVDLPRKHNKGGQSAQRFGRKRLLARLHYLNKISELATANFIDYPTNKINICGLVVAGSAEFKDFLVDHKHLDPRLQKIIISIVDISYGGMVGLHQAIDLSNSQLKGSELAKSRKILETFFQTIDINPEMTSFGYKQILTALEQGIVKILIIDEKLTLSRFTWKNDLDQSISGYGNTLQDASKDLNINDTWELTNVDLYIDWIVEHHSQFNIKLFIVNNSTDLGQQFCTGFGGLGAILRYPYHGDGHDSCSDEESFEF